MQRIEIKKPSDIKKAVEAAVAALQDGKVILYPTDTVYGLGADSLSNDAVDTIYRIKRTEPLRNLLSIVSDAEMLKRFAMSNQKVELLAEAFLPGPLALVLEKHPRVLTGIGRETETIGIRMPDNDFCIALAEAFGNPVISTSANVHRETTARTIDEILEQLGQGADDIALVIDAGELPRCEPSTIVDLSSGSVDMLREGPISEDEIREVLAA